MVKRWFTVSSALLTFSLLMACASITADTIRMSKDDVKALVGQPNVILVDVRTGGSYRSSKWKIQGSVREDPIDVETWARKYPKNATFILYCT